MNKAVSNEAAFGINVSLPENDPFTALLDDGWQTTHWFETRHERDRALKEMSREHQYSRKGDKPSLIFTPVDKPGTAT